MKILIILSFSLIPVNLLVIREDRDQNGEEKLAAGIRKTHEGNANDRGKFIILPTVRCAEVISNESGSDSQNRACQSHCRLLKYEFTEGECAAGFCICKLYISDVIQSALRKDDMSDELTGVDEKPSEHGVKCANLIRLGNQTGEENHKGCGVHCRLLNPKHKDGYCIKGACHCFAFQITKNPDRKVGHERGKIYKMKDVKMIDHKDSAEVDNRKCRSQCGNLRNYSDAKCIEGVYQCESNLGNPADLQEQRREGDSKPEAPDMRLGQHFPPKQSLDSHAALPKADAFRKRIVKKCEHRRRYVNEEICRSHCEAFSKDHTQGQCVNGICQCGYAVFENHVNELETNTRKNENANGRNLVNT